MVVLLKAGVHTPVMLLVDVVGNGLKVVPAQIGLIVLNVGVKALSMLS